MANLMPKMRPRRPDDPEIVDVLNPENVRPLETSVESPLGAPMMTSVPRPKPAEELTPEERRIRDLEHQLALERGSKDPGLVFDEPIEPAANAPQDGEDIIVIHFVNDGLSALGTIWHRGQELRIRPGSASHKETFDRLGRSWLDLRDDPAAQEAKYGQEKFRSGPWPGLPWESIAKQRYQVLAPENEGGRRPQPPTERDALRAARLEAARRGAPPRISV